VTGFSAKKKFMPKNVLSKNLSEIPFPVFSPILPSYLKNSRKKACKEKPCLDLDLSNKKPVCQPVFVNRLLTPVWYQPVIIMNHTQATACVPPICKSLSRSSAATVAKSL
jgi:hypothetical protein